MKEEGACELSAGANTASSDRSNELMNIYKEEALSFR